MFQKLFILCVLLTASIAVAQQLELHFIDVGQGDAVLIQSPTGQTVLYDGGRGNTDVLNYLRQIGVERVDLVIASHPDADHVGGLEAVLRAYQPRFYMDPAIPHTTQTYLSLLQTVEELGIQFLNATARTVSLGDASLQVSPPPRA